MTSRRLLPGGVIGLVVVGRGWVGWPAPGRSPAEVAAEAEPPPASNITVEVVREELSADVVTRGDIVFDDPVEVGLSGSVAQQPERLVVTQAVEMELELGEGAMAVEVVGRPVFLLTGEIPMYRDLRPGATGDDVLQLEEALSRLIFLGVVADEIWDADTGAAVAEWYETADYRPNGLSEEEEASLSAAQDRVRAAEGAVADAEAGLREAQSGSGESAVASARAELGAAEDSLDLAELDADRANQVAAEAVTTAETALTGAETVLAEAQTALTTAEGADPPPTPDTMAVLQQAVEEAEAAVATAVTTLDEARFQVGRTEAEQEALVDAARGRVNVAEASLADASRGVDTSSMRRQIETAREEVTAAEDELAELETELGTWLPAGEVVFLARLPVRVDQVAVARGSVIESSFITVSGSEVALRSSVTERDAPRVEEGMTVEIENPETGGSIAGVVSLKADRTGTNGMAEDRVYIEITPETIPPEIVGANVRVTIPVSSTGGEVLAVPAAALSATADGSTMVEVEEADGNLRILEVTTGLAAGGLVEVEPVDGSLAEGDLVVVGREGRSDGATTTRTTGGDG